MMSLIDSLLSAIIRLDGDALVMHVGEKPYVVTSSAEMNAFRGPLAWGQVELSSKPLTTEAVSAMLDQLLPEEVRRSLEEVGAVEHELPQTQHDSRFVVIAARGGLDIWLEIRHIRPTSAASIGGGPGATEAPGATRVFDGTAAPVMTGPPVATEAPVAADAPIARETPDAHETSGAPPASEAPVAPATPATPGAPIAMDSEIPELELVHDVSQETPTQADVDALLASTAASLLETEGQFRLQEDALDTPLEPVPRVEAAKDVAVDLRSLSTTAERTEAAPEVAALSAPEESVLSETPLAVVVPIARVVREAPPPQQAAPPSDLDRLLRIAAARGASALYTVARAKPVVRVDGEMQTLDSEDVLTPEVVEAFMMSVAPGPTREAVQAGETTEWICDMAEVGRVRCLSFRDHRGPGVIFRMLPPRAISAEQLGLSKEIQALSALPDGLVLLAGPRGSGTSTVVAAFVDLVNRTRSEHVVTIESQILFLHEAKRSFVSQREVRGRGDEIAAAARAALREDPDVLVIEELASADAVAAAVEAAQSGRLVFGGLRAATAEAAIERLLEQAPAERRSQLRSALASTLRGVIAQALLRKRGGGRVAARELLLNTPAVAALLAEGNLFQIRAALQSGRKLGMTSLNDSLAALVRAGVVDPGEAYRKAVDREGLIAQLRREGIDTSFVERLA
jgi:twitching motility protein PilT